MYGTRQGHEETNEEKEMTDIIHDDNICDAQKRWELLCEIVDLQACDESLWAMPAGRIQTVDEACLRHELRALAWLIEEASLDEIRATIKSREEKIKDD